MDKQKLKVRLLNDHLRRTRTGGRFLISAGIQAMGQARVEELLRLVARYNDFTPDNDPHGKRDFGSFDFNNDRILWRIEYYAKDQRYGSPDPSDQAKTFRVLTVFLALEY